MAESLSNKVLDNFTKIRLYHGSFPAKKITLERTGRPASVHPLIKQLFLQNLCFLQFYYLSRCPIKDTDDSSDSRGREGAEIFTTLRIFRHL